MSPGGKMYVLGEGVFGYARDKGVMCMCIRTSNCRPLDSREIEIAKNDKIFTVKRNKGN